MAERWVPLTAQVGGEAIGVAVVDITENTLEMRIFDSYAGPIGTFIPIDDFNTSVRVVNNDAMEVNLSPKAGMVAAVREQQEIEE